MSDTILNFLNRLHPSINAKQLVRVTPHTSATMRGWCGVCALECTTAQGDWLDIDVRYAWSRDIWQQALVDYGEDAQTLLTNPSPRARRKLVLYLCEPTTGLNDQCHFETLPAIYRLSGFWQAVQHGYVLLPTVHPFTLPAPPAEQKIDEANTLPLISVITPVYNGVATLEQTLQSVINQDYPKVEYIVVDGGSADGSVDLLRRYDVRIAAWQSERDDGIYDGMNKGLARANGYIYFLGADDVLLPGALSKVARYLVSNGLTISNVISGKRLVKSSFNWRMLIQNKVHHQSAFYPPRIKNWGLPARYRICADYYLNLKLYREHFPAVYVDAVTAFCRQTGVSHQAYWAAHTEISAIRRELYPRAHWLIEPYFVLKYQSKYRFHLHRE